MKAQRWEMKFVGLETERLPFRAFKESDFPIVYDWLGNDEDMKYRGGAPRSKEETHHYLAWAISNAVADECINFDYAVVLKKTGELIGRLSFLIWPVCLKLAGQSIVNTGARVSARKWVRSDKFLALECLAYGALLQVVTRGIKHRIISWR